MNWKKPFHIVKRGRIKPLERKGGYAVESEVNEVVDHYVFSWQFTAPNRGNMKWCYNECLGEVQSWSNELENNTWLSVVTYIYPS